MQPLKKTSALTLRPEAEITVYNSSPSATGALAINTDKKIPEEFHDSDSSNNKSISERTVDFLKTAVQSFISVFWGSNNNKLGVHTENIGQEIHTENIEQGIHTKNIGQGIHTENIERGIHTENIEQEIHTENIGQVIHTENIEQGIHTENIGQVIHTENIEQEIHTENIEQGIHTKNIGQGIHTENIELGIHTENIEQEIHTENIEQRIHTENIGQEIHTENTKQEVFAEKDVQETDIKPIEAKPSKTQQRKNRKKDKKVQSQLVTKEDNDGWQLVPARNKQFTPKSHKTNTLTKIPLVNSNNASYRKNPYKELEEIKKQIADGINDENLLLRVIDFNNKNPLYKTSMVLTTILDLCRLQTNLNRERTEHYIKKTYLHLEDNKDNTNIPIYLLKGAFFSLLNASRDIVLIDHKNISSSQTEKMYNALKERLGKIPYWEAKFDQDAKELDALSSKASKMAKTDLEKAMYIYLDLLESGYKTLKVVKFLTKNLRAISFFYEAPRILNNIEEKLLKLITRFNEKQIFFKAGAAACVRAEISLMNKNYKLSFDILLEQKQQETDTKIEEKNIMIKPATYIGVDLMIIRTVSKYDTKHAYELLNILVENLYGKNFPTDQPTTNYILDDLRIDMNIELKAFDKAQKLCENIDKFSHEYTGSYKIKMTKIALALNKPGEAIKFTYQLHREAYERNNQNGVEYNSNELCGDMCVDMMLAECLRFDYKKVQTVVDFLEKITKHYNIYDEQIHRIYCRIGKPYLAIELLQQIKGTVSIDNPADNFQIDDSLLWINENSYASSHSQIVKLLFNLKEKYKYYPPVNPTRIKVDQYYVSYLIMRENYSEASTILEDNLPYIEKQRRHYIKSSLKILVKDEKWNELDELWQKEKDHYTEKGTLSSTYVIGKINQYIKEVCCLIDKNLTHKVKELNYLSKLILKTIDKDIAKNNNDNLAVLYFLKYEMFLLLGRSKKECSKYYDQGYALLTPGGKDRIMTKVKYMEKQILEICRNLYNEKI